MADPDVLLRCPFCGGVHHATVRFARANEEGPSIYDDCWGVLCDARHGGCGANSGYRSLKSDAAALWNRRVSR